MNQNVKDALTSPTGGSSALMQVPEWRKLEPEPRSVALKSKKSLRNRLSLGSSPSSEPAESR